MAITVAVVSVSGVYTYGLYYLDPGDGKTYLCARKGEEAGTTVTLHYLPHELVGQYFEEG